LKNSAKTLNLTAINPQNAIKSIWIQLSCQILQITPKIISQFALNFMGKLPEKLRDETREICKLTVGDLVINWQNLKRFF
jgi:hypothetical protein